MVAQPDRSMGASCITANNDNIFFIAFVQQPEFATKLEARAVAITSVASIMLRGHLSLFTSRDGVLVGQTRLRS
jgi:hypothetical protein